ncbi:MAG: hypothetical protein ACK4SZ_02585 [Allosphingosinicella sp.]|uniref:hypothetical protein n=1 Tax=Allosphingosinicella sp. TaxID=2823234 RepID=UPI00395E43BE
MKTRIFGLALVASVAACTTPEPAAPVLRYSGVGCHTAPNLATALPLPAAKRAGESVRTPVDATTPCLSLSSAPSPYLVFAMPRDAHRLVEVGGAIEAARVFPPSVTILDGNGATLRTFAPTQYQNRGDRYSVQFIPQDGERYILVTVDQSLVGTSYEAVATGTTTSYIGTGYWTSGIDRTVSRSRSYHGAVVATVYDTSPASRAR